jgi:hypothetical protein
VRAPESPMLIVHVVRQFVASVGELEDVARELSKHQVERGFAVQVVRLDRIFRTKEASSETPLPAYEVIKGVEIRRIPYWWPLRYPIDSRVLRHIRTADIVHVHASNARVMVARSGGQGVIAGLLWLPRHFDATGCTLGVAVDASFDSMAGEVSRAPFWARAARLEWFYRLSFEPRRLASRYLVGIRFFFETYLRCDGQKQKRDASLNICGTNRVRMI